MIQALVEGERVVGTKQLLKAVNADEIRQVYLADDADVFVTRRLMEVCVEKRVEVIRVPTMREIGASCGIDVGAAAAGIRK